MKFRQSLLTLTICLFALRGFAFDLPAAAASKDQTQQLSAAPTQMTGRDGHKLTFTEKLMLKVLKKKMNRMEKKMKASHSSAEPAIEKGVYIIVAILIPFLAVGLATNFEGSDWLIALLLTVLFYLPGLIYALIKMKDYYG